MSVLTTVAGKSFNGEFTAKINFPLFFFYITITDADPTPFLRRILIPIPSSTGLVNPALWFKRSRYRSIARKNRGDLDVATNVVINLSNYELSDPDKTVLSKGLKYCPTPRNINCIELTAVLMQFPGRLRLKKQFHQANSSPESDNLDFSNQKADFLQHPLLRKTIYYTPRTGRSAAVDAYITAVETAILSAPVKKDSFQSYPRRACCHP